MQKHFHLAAKLFFLYRALSVGAALLYFSLRKACDYLQSRRALQLVRSRQARARANVARVGERYPSPTERQREIAGMDLPELKERLGKGELTCVEVVEAFIAVAVEVNK